MLQQACFHSHVLQVMQHTCHEVKHVWLLVVMFDVGPEDSQVPLCGLHTIDKKSWHARASCLEIIA